MERKVHMCAWKVRGRCAKGAQRCANVHGKVHKGAQRCTKGAQSVHGCTEGAQKVCKGSTEVHECAWKGAQGCAKVRKGARMCTKGAQREHKGAQGCTRVCECAQKGAQMCAKRCAIVCKRCARCAQVHKRERGGARKGAQVGPEPGQIGWVVRVWWVQAQCRESQRRRKISKNFRKYACFDRAYHEELTWRGLMGVAQGQEECGGSAS